MWCKDCQQDVPGIASPSTGGYACPRCAASVGVRASGPTEPIAAPNTAATNTAATNTAATNTPVPKSNTLDSATGGLPPSGYDSWEMDEQLRHIRRRLALRASDATAGKPAARRQWARVDAPHAHAGHWHRSAARKIAPTRSGRNTQFRLPTFTWSVLLLGLTASSCGGVLLGWSLVAARPELWAAGMPIFLGGQIVLLTGLILQLDRLWHDNRHTVEKLDHVDRSIHDLSAATSLLGNRHGSPGTAPRSHLAGGANPQALLADLKCQLDLLAEKINQADR